MTSVVFGLKRSFLLALEDIANVVASKLNWEEYALFLEQNSRFHEIILLGISVVTKPSSIISLIFVGF